MERVGAETGDALLETLSESGLVGDPDEMQRLWTPHRMVYVADTHQPDEHDCPFCHAPSLDDKQALTVYRGETSYALLNLYPYNNGHLLVCPYRHISTYDEATPEEVAEIGKITQIAMRVLKEMMGCHGFNLGMNQGEVAGAGIAAHIHQHVVPRWGGDANFLPIIAQTKAVPAILSDTREQLATEWERQFPAA